MSNTEIIEYYKQGYSIENITNKLYEKHKKETYNRSKRDKKDIKSHVETVIMGYLGGGR